MVSQLKQLFPNSVYFSTEQNQDSGISHIRHYNYDKKRYNNRVNTNGVSLSDKPVSFIIDVLILFCSLYVSGRHNSNIMLSFIY